MSKVEISQQIAAVELVLKNRLGHIENLKRLIRKKERTENELKIAELPIAGLSAAIKTLRWVQSNAIKLRKLAKQSN